MFKRQKRAVPCFTDAGIPSYRVEEVVDWDDPHERFLKGIAAEWPGFDPKRGPAIHQDTRTSRLEYVEKVIGRSLSEQERKLI